MIQRRGSGIFVVASAGGWRQGRIVPLISSLEMRNFRPGGVAIASILWRTVVRACFFGREDCGKWILG